MLFRLAALLILILSVPCHAQINPGGGGGGGGSGTVASSSVGQVAVYTGATTVTGAAAMTYSAGALTLGTANTTLGSLLLNGNTSGTITLVPQAAAGTYNFNLPSTVGASGALLTSAGGGSSPMTWTTTVAASGDVSISAGGVFNVTGIQGVAVSTPSGTGGVVLVNSATINTATITTGSILQDVINQGGVVSTAQLDKTSSVTFSTVTGLSINLTASGTYVCTGHLFGTSGALGGVQIQLAATNSLTATSMRFTATNWNAGLVNAQTTVTALAAPMGAATAIFTDMDIQGVIVVNAAGTINVQAAQNASNGTTTSILTNSYLKCMRTS